MQLFTRTNKTTVKKTISLYREQASIERAGFIKVFVFIPLSDFLFTVLLPLLTSFLVQSLITEPNNIRAVQVLLAGMAGTVLAGLFANLYGYHHLFYHEERVMTRLLMKASDTILRHSFEFFSKQKVGSLAGDINGFSRSYMQIMDALSMNASRIVVDLLASLIVIAFIAPIILVPVILMTIFTLLQTLYSNQQRATYRNKRKELQSKLIGSIADVLGNQTLVRMFARRGYEVKRLLNERRAIEQLTYTEIDILQKHAGYRMAVLYSLQLTILGISAYLVTQNTLSIAAMVFIVTYLGRFTGSIFNINHIIRNIEQAFLDAAKVTEILSTPVEITDQPGAPRIAVEHGAIQFRDLSFAYEDAKNSAVFTDLSIDIPAGQRVGLVGKSGGGKTTLTSLLLRYMEIQKGAISIDGQNIAHVTQDSLRESIAYVPQDPFLFHRTLRENIAYGKPGATEAEIIAAAEKAYAMEFIDKLPGGLDTIVGERGIKLSGGQRQRIAIARAFLKDAPILVLDEATSALDSESEHLIQQSLERLMNGRTSLVVAHRLSTISRLDRIIVLENGDIIEDGTHSELLESDNLYAKLWKRQSGGFIEE